MNVSTALWHEEHVYFSSLLDRLQKELDAFHAGGTPGYELMLDIVSYLRDYGDQYHHPREEEAFRRLAPRCPELALELARLSQEHRVIAAAGDLLATHLAAAVSGAIIPRALIEAAGSTYLVYYRNHLATEEEEVLLRAGLLLTEEDWAAVLACAPAGAARLPIGHYKALQRRIALEA